MNKAVVYIHGKGGSADEAGRYEPLFEGYEVIGLDHQSQTPWEAEKEFPAIFDKLEERYEKIVLIANSIGAHLALYALAKRKIEQAFFISPIVDMEKLILDMMSYAKISEERLKEEKEIETSFGETLSYEYLSYVREHPICWTIPTVIFYGEKDELTSLEMIESFAEKTGAKLRVMENGEHWFHTAEQLAFIDRGIREWMGISYEVHGKIYEVKSLLGHGKGGYSYLAECDGRQYVLKKIHHEPCSYYSFGNKIQAESHDYERLKEAGIRIPVMIDIDEEKEIVIKDYVKGDTIFEYVLQDKEVSEYIGQVRKMAEQAKTHGLNIDYFPTNFIVCDGLLWYVDYECNEYMEEWDFDHWGYKYWSKTREFEDYLKEKRNEG